MRITSRTRRWIARRLHGDCTAIALRNSPPNMSLSFSKLWTSKFEISTFGEDSRTILHLVETWKTKQAKIRVSWELSWKFGLKGISQAERFSDSWLPDSEIRVCNTDSVFSYHDTLLIRSLEQFLLLPERVRFRGPDLNTENSGPDAEFVEDPRT